MQHNLSHHFYEQLYRQWADGVMMGCSGRNYISTIDGGVSAFN